MNFPLDSGCTYLKCSHLVLYACTVFYDVYRLYSNGVPLTAEAAQRFKAARGDLRMRKQYSYRPGFIAQLLKPDLTYVIPVLTKAFVLRIGDDAMLIAGLEVHPGRGSKSPASYLPQRWLCKHPPEPELRALSDGRRIDPQAAVLKLLAKAIERADEIVGVGNED